MEVKPAFFEGIEKLEAIQKIKTFNYSAHIN